jgi:2'-5' RNA ligase
MRHRVFIAINLPEDIKKRLSDYQKKWPTLPVRWVREDNLHITLVFLGYLNDEELLEVIKIVKEIASKNPSFSINLNKIIYGPPKKFPPRMIWIEGEKSQELANLQKDLENALYSSSVKGIKEGEIRPYSPHITLGRIKNWEFRKIEPEERPGVSEEISLSFPVESIEVMESQLKRGGSEYTILESAPLGRF